MRLLTLLDSFARCRVLVIGDLIADEFIYGHVARVSREAPVLILEYDKTDLVPGGAANAANNVGALGARTRAVGLVGDDETGRRMLEALHANVERQGVLTRPGFLTPTKTRVLAGGVHSAKQQVVRMDRGTHIKADAAAREQFRRQVLRAAARCDAVLVSDYGAGLVTPALVGEVKKIVRGEAAARGGNHAGDTSGSRLAPRRRVPILIDSRYDLGRYKGLTACTPNEAEVEAMLDVRINDSLAALERAGREMLSRTRHDIVLITRGSRGMSLFQRDRPTEHLPIHGTDEVADVTGAGDTVIATFTLALAAGGTPSEAARLANYAGGLVVMKRGTATVTADELRRAIRMDRAFRVQAKKRSTARGGSRSRLSREVREPAVASESGSNGSPPLERRRGRVRAGDALEKIGSHPHE